MPPFALLPSLASPYKIYSPFLKTLVRGVKLDLRLHVLVARVEKNGAPLAESPSRSLRATGLGVDAQVAFFRRERF